MIFFLRVIALYLIYDILISFFSYFYLIYVSLSNSMNVSFSNSMNFVIHFQ